MEARGGYWELQLMGMPRTTGAGGMDVVDVLPTGTQKLPTAKREKNYTQRQTHEQEP